MLFSKSISFPKIKPALAQNRAEQNITFQLEETYKDHLVQFLVVSNLLSLESGEQASQRTDLQQVEWKPAEPLSVPFPP